MPGKKPISFKAIELHHLPNSIGKQKGNQKMRTFPGSKLLTLVDN